MKKALCHIALGANLGDRVNALREAARRIDALPGTSIVARSAIYETPPWGKTDQAAFANAVIAIRTGIEPDALLQSCLAIEATMGRVRRERWGPRLIDIDLLTHGETSMKTERLTLPHPAMAERAFVLVPLLEIAPQFRIGAERARSILDRIGQAGIVAIDTM
jgi:2-amino-4-hydroxy-6-hydroxymethyldihydropteridine diphosphokinase